MYLVWHLRRQADPLQAWLRQPIEALVPAALAEPDRAAWPPETCGGVRLLPERAIASER
jgi:hypothetical protein